MASSRHEMCKGTQALHHNAKCSCHIAKSKQILEVENANQKSLHIETDTQ